jgi:nucleotide-binding universal stress UspA family protein
MERLLIALDSTSGSLKSIPYVNRILVKSGDFHLTLFHVIPTTSPDFLKKEEILRIEELHREAPRLSGYFWKDEDQRKMEETFREAKHSLLTAGFEESHIKTLFSVQYDDIAQVIVKEARSLGCSTIIVGRRGVGRVKEFILGSVSSSVTKIARGMTVWVVDY